MSTKKLSSDARFPAGWETVPAGEIITSAMRHFSESDNRWVKVPAIWHGDLRKDFDCVMIRAVSKVAQAIPPAKKSKRVVHGVTLDGLAQPLCEEYDDSNGGDLIAEQGEVVTCKHCLAIIVAREAASQIIPSISTWDEAAKEIERLRAVNEELKEDTVALSSIVLLDGLTKKNFDQFRKAGLSLTGATTANVDEPYIATYLSKLLLAAKAFGWKRMDVAWCGNHWRFREKK